MRRTWDRDLRRAHTDALGRRFAGNGERYEQHSYEKGGSGGHDHLEIGDYDDYTELANWRAFPAPHDGGAIRKKKREPKLSPFTSDRQIGL